MIKIRLFAITLFLYVIHSAFASELENLWQKCEKNSESIFSATQNLDYYQTVKNNSRVLYPLSLDISASPDFYQNYDQYSDEIELGNASVTLTQTLPGGAKLAAGTSYSVYSGYRNWSSSKGYTDKGYSDAFSAHIQYSQSLNPYWLQGSFENPAKAKLSLAVNSGEYNLMQAKKNAYTKILSLCVQFRRNARNIFLTEKQREVLKINLDSLKEMHSSNSAFLSDIWQAERTLGEAESSLNSYNLEKEEIIKALSELCGSDFEISEDAILPDNQVQLFSNDPFLNNLQVQLQSLESQFLLDKQNSAPVISISGQVRDKSKLKNDIGLNFNDDTNYLHWSATISGRINNLYGGDAKLYRKKFETERAKLEKQIEEYIKKNSAEKEYYEKTILSYEENISTATTNLINEKENFDGIKQLYEIGQKRQIDVLYAEINYLKQRYTVENLKDALWQVKWSRVQLSD